MYHDDVTRGEITVKVRQLRYIAFILCGLRGHCQVEARMHLSAHGAAAGHPPSLQWGCCVHCLANVRAPLLDLYATAGSGHAEDP